MSFVYVLLDISRTRRQQTTLGGALGPDWSADLCMTGTGKVGNKAFIFHLVVSGRCRVIINMMLIYISFCCYVWKDSNIVWNLPTSANYFDWSIWMSVASTHFFGPIHTARVRVHLSWVCAMILSEFHQHHRVWLKHHILMSSSSFHNTMHYSSLFSQTWSTYFILMWEKVIIIMCCLTVPRKND